MTGFTIAIPTYNRSDDLVKTLESLSRINSSSVQEYEVVVIDNNSTDRTPQVVPELAPAFHGRLRYALEVRQGLNHARNRAVAEARYVSVALRDDEVEVDENWRNSLAAAYEGEDYAAVGGRAYLIYPCERPKWLGERSEGLLSAVNWGPNRRLA